MVLTIEGAAELLHFAPSTVRRFATEGRLPAAKVGKCWRFDESLSCDWLRRQSLEKRETMPVRRRRGSPYWQIRFQLAGREIRSSTRTTDRGQAEQLEEELRRRYWRQVKLGEKQYTWDDAVERCQAEDRDKRSWERTARALARLSRLLDGAPLKEITRDNVLRIREIRRRQVAASTVNRELAVLRFVLNRCVTDWGMLDSAPKVPLFRLGAHRAALGDSRAGPRIARAVAPTFARHDDPGVCHRSATFEHHGTGVEPGRHCTVHRLHPGHSGQGTARNCCPTKCRRPRRPGTMAREARALRVFLQATGPYQAGIDSEMARMRHGGGHGRLPLSRPPSYLGKLAGTGGNASLAPSGARWLVIVLDGATIRAPLARATSSNTQIGRSWVRTLAAIPL